MLRNEPSERRRHFLETKPNNMRPPAPRHRTVGARGVIVTSFCTDPTIDASWQLTMTSWQCRQLLLRRRCRARNNHAHDYRNTFRNELVLHIMLLHEEIAQRNVPQLTPVRRRNDSTAAPTALA